MTKQVDTLKSEGSYEAAGREAAKTNRDRYYGCHFGMRSSKDRAMTEFYAGYDAQKAEDSL